MTAETDDNCKSDVNGGHGLAPSPVRPIALADFQKELGIFNNWAQHGCGNHGCRIKPPKGMGTNATCRCTPRAFAESLLWLACELDKHGKYGRWPNTEISGGGARPATPKGIENGN